jgi:GrpB-like predicted nucleotidyltransferase (UPF0157 family)
VNTGTLSETCKDRIENIKTKRRSNVEPIQVIPYLKIWQEEFNLIGGVIRKTLGDTAIRIDHIGSTGVEGLDSKPIIDVQISVKSLEPMIYKPMLESTGYLHRSENPDKTKRYFRESNGIRRTHIHVRENGSWSEQFALLFRDYLRTDASDRIKYAEVKYHLANLYRHNRSLYVEGKDRLSGIS